MEHYHCIRFLPEKNISSIIWVMNLRQSLNWQTPWIKIESPNHSLGYPADLNKKWPVVIFLHGSGERGDDKTDLNTLHDCWSRAYAEPKMWDWLLAKKKD
jgi:hypothetical protein